MSRTRRDVLRAGLASAAVVALGAGAGCASPEPTPLSADQVALNAAAQAEQDLVVLLARGLTDASPAQQRAADAAGAAHQRHVAELVAAGAAEPTPGTPTTTTPPPGSTTSPAPTTTPPPAAPDARAVAVAQEAQADALTRSALGVSPDVAVLLGSVAASDAAHAWQLRNAG
jgi:hypothetical protein